MLLRVNDKLEFISWLANPSRISATESLSPRQKIVGDYWLFASFNWNGR